MNKHPIMSELFIKGFTVFIILALAALVIHVDVRLLGSHAGESSFIEYTQETILLVVALLYFSLFRTDSYRSFAVLLGGFFTCLLIRELDGVFDQIVHGFWKYPAWAVAISCIYYSFFRHRESTLEAFQAYLRHPSFGLMLAAMGTLMVFSRLFGMGDLWQVILNDGYHRAAKNIAEEGTELLAYTLTLCAAAWHVISIRKPNSVYS
ncbi:hypothetical protein ACPV50_18790 [Vibrio astriarenae]